MTALFHKSRLVFKSGFGDLSGFVVLGNTWARIRNSIDIPKKAVPPAARIEQTVTVGVPIAAVCCERTRLQLRPFLHWCVCPKESMAPGGRLNIGEALGALP